MIAHSFRLGEVDQEDPSIPPFDLRATLQAGDLAELILETPEEVHARWALIDRVLGPGVYFGTLETGEEIEFGAENVIDVEERPHQSHSMGAWYDVFKPKVEKEKPQPRPQLRSFEAFRPEPRPPELWEILVPEAEKKDPHFQYSKVFDIFGPSARSAPRPAPTPPPPGATPAEKRGWFDFLKRQPKTEVIGPIPPPERREQHSFHRLPGPPPPPGPVIVAEEAPAGPVPQAIIVPEVQASISPIASALPDNLFEILAPGPVPAGPVSKPQASLPAAIATETSLPIQMDAFSILEPMPAPSFGPPSIAQDPFHVIAAEQPTAFDILVPQAGVEPQGMVVRPEGERGISTVTVFDMFDAPPPAPQPMISADAPSLFDVLGPPPPPPAPPPQSPEAAVARAQKRAKKKAGPWLMPSREEWVRWIKEKFNLDDLWKYIRSERNSEYFLDQQLGDEEGGTSPVETWADLDWDSVFEFFGVPESVYGPYLERIAKEEEQFGYADEAWQDFQESLVYPVGNAVYEAFKTITPEDIPGGFVLGDDGDNGTWGLLYFERLDPKKASRRQKEVLQEKERNEREAKEAQRHRKSELKRIWGKMPGPEDLVGWIEEKFDLDAMFSDIQKAVKSKTWKSELREYGQAEFGLDVIADLGPKRAKEYAYDIASYFGIPPDVISLYEETESIQDLWNEIFWPFFENLQEAFVMLLPYAGLPGIIVVDEDQEDRLVIEYREEDTE